MVIRRLGVIFLRDVLKSYWAFVIFEINASLISWNNHPSPSLKRRGFFHRVWVQSIFSNFPLENS